MEAPKHPRQEERLSLLRSFDILDTEKEPDFDDIVTLAAQICGTAISVVNLIDADRQWFKAETGLGVRETPLSTSICSHVILEEEFVEIPDTLKDPRMMDNPLCQGNPGLRFYAGALLVSDHGLPLGTLCVLDYEPRQLTPLQRETLRVLARQVMAQLEMRRALSTNKILRQEVDHRVKNSLQSLSSLVRIQQRRAQTDETRSALASVESRIKAVAELHGQLYRKDGSAVIDLADYVAAVAGNLREMAPPGVQLSVAAQPCRVPSAQAVALGTLINEFAANSFKHAFPNGERGVVMVNIGPGTEAGTLCVTCADNGVGLPSEAGAARRGLGMLIAQVIGAELQTDIKVDPVSSGLSISLTFATGAVQDQGSGTL